MTKNTYNNDILPRYKTEAPHFPIIRTYNFYIMQRPKYDKRQDDKKHIQ